MKSNNFICINAFLILFNLNESLASSSFYNVVDFGANPSGNVDSTEAFLKAWGAACGSNSPSTVYVPHGKFLIQQTSFKGPCNTQPINFISDGVLLAPSDYKVLGNADHWIAFEKVNGVSINGGILDGQGTSLWACKFSGGYCPIGTTNLKVINSQNVFVNGLHSFDSQFFHIVIYGSKNVTLQSIKLRAPGNSPNTDGIHVRYSSQVKILNPKIGTGDDCISIGPSTDNLIIDRAICGPGHGISIGSLGRNSDEGGVQNVTVTRSIFLQTQNGFRIKTWATTNTGFVKGIWFRHARLANVQNPIIIDQNYCAHDTGCPNKPSGVKISDITYDDIHGSSASENAVKFECSSMNPCSDIKLENIVLAYENRVPKSSCQYASGTATGRVQPPNCLHPEARQGSITPSFYID